MECGRFYDAAYVKNAEGIPHCECGGMIKPDVVLYEEGLDPEVIQISAASSMKAGKLHMMKAENPIFIISGGGIDE